MRRPRKFRRKLTNGWASSDAMENPGSPSRMSMMGMRDTGFPEHFCGHRNTSLPHPDANLSPDACLTEDDITVSRAAVRNRMSVLVGRDRSREIATGLNSGDTEQLFCASPVLMDETSKLSTIGKLAFTSLHGAELTKQLGSDGSRTSKDGDSLVYTSGGSSAGNSPTQPRMKIEPSSPKTSRSRSFLKRLARI